MISALPDLPVNSCLPALARALDAGRNAVLVAPPGAGKTTIVPLALLDPDIAPWRGDGTILVLEPRRLAARAAAERIAVLLGESVGQRAGFRTRLERAVSAATRIEVVTTGLLVRRLLSDPGLDGVAAVMLDEVHERSLEADLALALLLDVQAQLRPELRLLAASATADAAKLAPLLGAETVESAGRAYPVRIIHARTDIASVRDLPEAMARAVRAALAEAEGDVLAFLPGMAEIRRTMAALEGVAAETLPLHGDLPPGEQAAALREQAQRRVVLATAIAETSLTVPGVRIVIDGGFRRAPRLDPATGLTRLATVRVSRAAAAQRAGRAGREAPGEARRLWTEATQRGLAEQERPEILEAELSGLVLAAATWGTDVADLRFPDRPPEGALAAARDLLARLGAMEGTSLTSLGQAMARLGAHPRLAAMMAGAETPGERALAAALAALLEERDVFRRPAPNHYPPADISARVAALEGAPPPEADRAGLRRVRDAARQYAARLNAGGVQPEGDPGRLLACGFPDRLALSRGEAGRFRLSGGGSASLPPTDALARQKLLVAASLESGSSTRIALAAPLDLTRLPPALAAQIETSLEVTTDPVSGAVLARRRRRLGALVLEDTTQPADPDQRAAVLAARAAADMSALPWTEAAKQVQARIERMREIEPGAWPDVSDAALAASTATWLEPYLRDARSLAEMPDLAGILRNLLSYAQQKALDAALPETLALPRGTARVDYTEPVPLATARAQAFYGLRETPRLAGGLVKLRLALLSPAGRPIAVTADLARFWQTGWADARRDMRGRYPKHDWPEHPGEAA